MSDLILLTGCSVTQRDLYPCGTVVSPLSDGSIRQITVLKGDNSVAIGYFYRTFTVYVPLHNGTFTLVERLFHRCLTEVYPSNYGILPLDNGEKTVS